MESAGSGVYHPPGEVAGDRGERAGIRTRDPLIKSQMLYRLSYALGGSRKRREHKPHALRRQSKGSPPFLADDPEHHMHAAVRQHSEQQRCAERADMRIEPGEPSTHRTGDQCHLDLGGAQTPG